MRSKKIVIFILLSLVVIILGVGGYLYVKYGQYWLNPILKSEIATSILGKIEKDRYKIVWAYRYLHASNLVLIDKLTGMKFIIGKTVYPYLAEEPLEGLSIEDFLKILKETPEDLRKIKVTMRILEKDIIVSETGLEIPYAKATYMLDGNSQLLFCTTFTYKEKGINLYNNIDLIAICDEDKYDEQAIEKLIDRITKQKKISPYVEKKLEETIKKLQDEDSDLNTKKEAVTFLAKVGNEKAMEILGIALKHKDKEVRRHAALVIGRSSRSNEAIRLLATALEDEDSEVRWHAVYALEEMKDKRTLEPLITALKNKDRKIRSYAALALAGIGDERGVEPLILSLKDEDPIVRATAAIALGEIGDKRAIKPLISALKDNSIMVRRDTANALGCAGDESAIPELTLLLKDEDETVRREAKKAIEKIKARSR